MLCQQVLTAKNEVCEQLCCFLCLGTFCTEHIVSPRFEWDVVRRCATKMLVASFDNQQMPVLYACIEVNSLRAKLLLKEAHQHISLFRFKPSTRMILQEVAFEANQIATQSQVIFRKFYANARCLKRSATFIDKVLVVAENA